jgi:23S rRNA A2030 N6-methylase RlmJ
MKEYRKHPEEFDEFCDLIQEYLIDATKEYYSGFIGAIRKLFRRKSKTDYTLIPLEKKID